MTLKANSTNISKGETQITISSSGDTILSMRMEDARGILSDVLQKEILDSLVIQYEIKDSLNIGQISILKSQILELIGKSDEQNDQIETLNLLINNSLAEIKIKNDIISQQKKKIRKNVTQKWIFIGTSIVLPAVLAGVMIKLK